MPKKAEFTIFKSGNRYILNIPASLSPSGKRQRQFHETKKAATDAKTEYENKLAHYGKESLAIKPALAEDATKAADILAEYGATLTEAANFYAEARKRQAASIPFAELWKRHLEALANRSEAHLHKLELLGRKLNPVIGKKLVCEIDHRELADFLAKKYKTPYGFNLAVRSLSPAFTRAVREGWTTANPCKRIERRDTGRHEIRFLDVEQSRNVLVACKDFRQDKKKPEYLRRDCRDCVAAVALMMFGGVRPKEVSRLTWNQIDMEEGTVFVPNKKAKTDRSRFFEMPDTLKAWLETVPMSERLDSVVPSGWDKKWQVLRRHAGFKHINDALRKTFVTHHLAAYGDVNKTRAIIGHEAGDVMFTNYRGAVSKKQGLAFFKILPADEQGEKVVKLA